MRYCPQDLKYCLQYSADRLHGAGNCLRKRNIVFTERNPVLNIPHIVFTERNLVSREPNIVFTERNIVFRRSDIVFTEWNLVFRKRFFEDRIWRIVVRESNFVFGKRRPVFGERNFVFGDGGGGLNFANILGYNAVNPEKEPHILSTDMSPKDRKSPSLTETPICKANSGLGLLDSNPNSGGPFKMAKNADWFPTRLADQAAMFTNITGKIGGYTTVLPITTAQRDEILLICGNFCR